jgi:hypothetical protein
MKCEFFDRFSGENSNIKFYQMSAVGVMLFHADEQTERRNVVVASRDFANAHKKLLHG